MKRVILGLLWVSLLIEISSAIPIRSWLIELIDNLALYFALLHVLGLVLLPWLRSACGPRLLVVTTVLLLHSLYSALSPLAPFYFAQTQQALSCEQPEVLKVTLANVSSDNTNAAELMRLLTTRGSDIVAIFETTQKSVDSAATTYAQRMFVHQSDGFGIGVLSTRPFAGEPMVSLGDELRPVVIVRPQLGKGGSFDLAVFDALPPFENESLYLNWLLVRRMGMYLRHEASTAVVLTDLNATPYSNFYRGFLKDGRLSNVMWGRGFGRTWDMEKSLIRFTLDHAFVKGDIAVKEAQLFDLMGSDHRGIEMTLEICAETASRGLL
jgi:endonuclease/exonuclease/phosphatase (EEP) superfamily protein YafD